MKLNERIAFRECHSNQQKCVVCGEFMKEKELALSLSNKGDKLQIKKNIWMHVPCVPAFNKLIKKNLTKIAAEAI